MLLGAPLHAIIVYPIWLIFLSALLLSYIQKLLAFVDLAGSEFWLRTVMPRDRRALADVLQRVFAGVSDGLRNVMPRELFDDDFAPKLSQVLLLAVCISLIGVVWTLSDVAWAIRSEASRGFGRHRDI
jgi:hypothetical protein